ncbi:unnamed protein product [Phytophthora lilii]|uniref:Unnamed protein product n=1 Tax=Phytophthora lilii TaxID=2077276 RepID=A0A9W6XUX8_9STRA|nr:unnamed protein product [Phytophthora lilii]
MDSYNYTPRKFDEEISNNSLADDPLDDLRLRYIASANALISSEEASNEFDHEGPEVPFEDYAHELAFLPDLTMPASTTLDYDGDNVKNPALDPIAQLKLVETLRKHEKIMISSGNALPPPTTCDRKSTLD